MQKLYSEVLGLLAYRVRNRANSIFIEYIMSSYAQAYGKTCIQHLLNN